MANSEQDDYQYLAADLLASRAFIASLENVAGKCLTNAVGNFPGRTTAISLKCLQS